MKAPFLIFGLTALAIAASSCRREETFPALGDRIASPVDIKVADDGSHFYVLNADFDRTYNQGSILVLDKEGTKIRAVGVPRMGRSLTVAGSDMIVTVDSQDDDNTPKALLFDVSDPANPVQKREWDLPCSPFNAVARKAYKYFALTCVDGQLFVGTFGEDRSASTLKLVREYGVSRRALYIDPVRGMLLGFTTDPSRQSWSDALYKDTMSYNKEAQEIKGPDGESLPNEIPDDRENTPRAQSNRGSAAIYQFFVYDFNREASPPNCTPTADEDCVFPYRQVSDPQIQREQRWLYFKLFNFDGTPDPNSLHEDPSYKYYRTNFWSAEPDPVDGDVFYLSHRGLPTAEGSPHANQVVRVNIVGNLLVPDEQPVPFTETALSFERVYGFNGAESSKLHYPGDFSVVQVLGQKLLLVNNFRDLVNWVRGDVYFSIAAKVIDNNTWYAETTTNQDPLTSWYQVALNREGRAVAGLFYGNAVMLLDVIPGVGIRELKRIE